MHLRTLAAGLAAATLIPFASANAAPQMLALVATNGAVPFVCEGTTCRAELTSFCLEETRSAPRAGRFYRLVPTRALALVVTTAAGSERRVPAGPNLRFVVTRRGVAGVRATVNRSLLRKLGAVRLAIEVGARVSLLPMPRPGDGAPHGAADIARVTGPLRATGTALVDRAGPNIEAARMVNRAINRLPAQGRSDRRGRSTAWRAALAATASPVGRARARLIYRQCRRWTAAPGTPFNLRQCLEGRHMGLISALNKRYWDATRPGM
jgi:hypothetical protein